MPYFEDFNWEGSTFSAEQFAKLMCVNREDWKREVLSHEELFIKLFDRLPKEFVHEKQLLLSRLWRSPETWETPHE